MALLALGVASFGSMWCYYLLKNKRRRAGKEDHRIGGLSDSEIEELGDKNPRFIYVT